jgi:hypothetical protein
MMSLRAEGHPKEAKPGAADVHSAMTGQFVMDRGELRFQSLKYTLPGADVALAGVYSMDGNKFNFTGTVRTKAKLSEMVASRWKSLLLKPVDPFFDKTKGAPKFGLDLHHKGTAGS